MAVKGKGYLKTSWAFQERPVASSKLNTWDDRIESALELAYRLLSLAWGGGDGVIRNAAGNDLAVTATVPSSRSVDVAPGYAFISAFPYKLAESIRTAAITPPVSQPRIDLVQARLATWDVSIVMGAEAASPEAPSPEADCIALAQLYLRPGMASIKTADDSTNGYIIDVRNFL
ncbi:MAG: hypothetical protein JXR94_18025 [Candidatus Hydrogenedentes bacterium]|nr:hypothetical protein [Candidatus Hydrogenedentota bacterium]